MIVCVLLTALLSCLRAEDTNAVRGYIQFRSGEFDSRWGVHDSWGLSGGVNLNRHLGIEAAGDVFERYDDLGEIAVTSFVPQVRLRYPMLRDRLVPYVFAGVGPAFVQFNDPRFVGDTHEVDLEGWSVAVASGVGLEYYLADNVAFALEAKYLWVEPTDQVVDGVPGDYDTSSLLASLGLRVYFKENLPRPLVVDEPHAPVRFYAAARYGGSILTDAEWGPGVRLRPESSGIGDVVDQYPSLSMGLDVGRHWGVELTLGNMEHVLYQDNVAIGEYSQFSGLAQVRYRVPLVSERWAPYVSGGMGIVYAEWNDCKTTTYVAGKGVYPLAATGIGVEYFIARNFSLSADGWWQYTWNHRLQIRNEHFKGDFSSFQLQLGFRVYLFER